MRTWMRAGTSGGPTAGSASTGSGVASGWAALTPTELKIATMVAEGASTPDIARGMFLSRRTVQTYFSHILAKLGAKGRVDIAREALRQGIRLLPCGPSTGRRSGWGAARSSRPSGTVWLRSVVTWER